MVGKEEISALFTEWIAGISNQPRILVRAPSCPGEKSPPKADELSLKVINGVGSGRQGETT